MQIYSKCLCFLYLILLLSNKVNGQSSALNLQSIPSPNTASLGIYGEVPVSYHTGLPNISIPLHHTKGAALSLPISLDYHASGNRPEQQPGWVGLGWNLTVGGAITRTVKQQPDEYNIEFNTPGGRKLGRYWWNHSGASGLQPGYLSDAYWSDNASVRYSPVPYLTNSTMDYAVDREPDEFSFNFLGYSGTFYLDQNHQWKVRCDKPLKVEFDDQFITPFVFPLIGSFNATRYLSKTFKHFTIIDEFGNRYIFGSETANNDNAIEYSTPLETNTDGQLFCSNTWYLTKIISANQTDVIKYEYERGPFTSSASYNYTAWSIGQGGAGYFSPPCTESGKKDGLSGTLISPVYLREITYPKKNLKIKFNFSKRNDHKYDRLHLYSAQLGYDASQNHLTVGANGNYIPFFQRFPGDYDNFDGTNNFIWVKLNEIVITDLYESVPIRKINFSYIENAESRLKLNTIQLSDDANVPVQKYSFGYNPVQLPPYLMSITDHWGFNTGKVLNQPLSNKYQNLSVFYSANAADLLSPTSIHRTPASDSNSSNKAEILETITYPTGGKTTFEYEIHDYNKAVSLINRSQIDNVTGYAGGLRISKITNTDIQGHSETKEYYYKRGYHANANIYNLPSSGVLNVKPTYTFGVPQSPAVYFPQLGANFFYSYKTSTPIIPLTLNSSGVHVGYSEVVEKRADGSYTIYKYTNHDVTGYTDSEPINEFPVLTNTSEMTRYIRYRSAKNDRGKLLSSEVYTNTDKRLHKKEIEYGIVGDTNTDVVRAVFWKYNNACEFSSTTASMGVLSSIAYTIPYYAKLPSIEHEYIYNQSDNNYVHTSKQYYYDQNTKLLKSVQSNRSDGQTTNSTLYYPNDFSTQMPYSEMVGKNMLDFVVKKEEMINNNITKAEFTNFKKWHSNVYAPETIQFKVGSASLQNKLAFHSYDESGNITESSDGNGGARQASIWGYNSTLPTATVKNAKHSDVFHTSFEDGDGNNYEIDSKTGSFNYSGSYNKVLTGLSSGLYTLTYWQKSNGKWSQVSVDNINVIDTYTISLSGQIDEVRFHPSNSSMTSYTYNPLIGMSSTMDPGGKATYYEYDSFQRLKNIKDQTGSIVKNYQYNYDRYFRNSEQAQSYQKNDCISGNGSIVSYVVPANTYSAPTLQEANALALADITANGQAYANANGACLMYARLEISNIYTQEFVHDYDVITTTTADLTIRFYSDQNCTVPYVLTNDIDVNVITNYNYINWQGPNETEDYYTLSANTSELYLGQFYLDDGHSYNGGPFTGVQYIYYLASGGNYIPLSTHYN